MNDETVKEECDCSAKLADMLRALELLSTTTEEVCRTLDKLKDAVNFLGEQSQLHTDQVNTIVGQISGIGAMISNIGPAGMMKVLMGKKGI